MCVWRIGHYVRGGALISLFAFGPFFVSEWFSLETEREIKVVKKFARLMAFYLWYFLVF